jgi:hypothetical protein
VECNLGSERCVLIRNGKSHDGHNLSVNDVTTRPLADEVRRQINPQEQHKEEEEYGAFMPR